MNSDNGDPSYIDPTEGPPDAMAPMVPYCCPECGCRRARVGCFGQTLDRRPQLVIEIICEDCEESSDRMLLLPIFGVTRAGGVIDDGEEGST